MTEQQQHLKAALDQQSALIDEIQKLNNNLTSKRELATKLQGVIEYLTGVGVSLPPEELPQEDLNNSEESIEE
jgi:hypothetical protein